MKELHSSERYNEDLNRPRYDSDGKKVVGPSTNYEVYKQVHSPLTASPIQTTTYAPSMQSIAETVENIVENTNAEEVDDGVTPDKPGVDGILNHLFNSFNDFDDEGPKQTFADKIVDNYKLERHNSRVKRKPEHQFRSTADDRHRPEEEVRWSVA